MCTQVQSGEAPVLQLPQEVPGAHAAGEVQLALAVDAEDVPG